MNSTGAFEAYPDAELVWAQEEPKNQGAWTFLLSELAPSLPGRSG